MNDALKSRDIARILYQSVGNDNLATDKEREFARTVNGLDNVTKIGISDLTSMKMAFSLAASTDPYAHSPAYYALTGRRGLWMNKMAGEGQEFTTFFFCLHPNLKDTVVIFPPFGDQPMDAIAKFLQDARETGMSFRIGRTPRDWPLEEIQTRYPQIRASRTTESVLDWTYPVHTINCADLIKREGKDYARIRQTMNKFLRSSAMTRELDFNRDVGALQSLAQEWEAKTNHYDTYDLRTNYFNYLAKLAVDQQDLHLRGLIVSVNGQDKGFSIWEPESNGGRTANLFASQVSDFDMTNLATYLTVVSAEKMMEEGAEFMCLGGSETTGMDRYKRGFVPAMSTPLDTIELSVPPDFEV